MIITPQLFFNLISRAFLFFLLDFLFPPPPPWDLPVFVSLGTFDHFPFGKR